MLFISEKLVNDFYTLYQTAVMEGEYLESGGEVPSKDWTSYCIQDLLEVARDVIGVDDITTWTEVAAVHEVLSVIGHNINMTEFKLQTEKRVEKEAKSRILTSYADARLTKYKFYKETGRQVTLDEVYDDIDKFLWMWVACICEIIVADCRFKDEERKLLIEYVAEFSTYVTAKFGKLYYISDNISKLMAEAQKLSCD